jgi:hypothetical protein
MLLVATALGPPARQHKPGSVACPPHLKSRSAARRGRRLTLMDRCRGATQIAQLGFDVSGGQNYKRSYMNTINQELEQEFLKLSDLNHIGMALLQFAYNLGGTKNVQKEAGGVFRLGFVAFSFPEGDKCIRLHVDLEINKIEKMDLKWLPLHTEQGLQVCKIKHAGQLGCAARYIESGRDKYLETRQTTSFDPTTN